MDVQSWNDALAKQLRAPTTHRTLPTLQPMLWIAEQISPTAPQFTHINRHIRAAEDFVIAGGLSSYQGERSLDIPEELRIDDGRILKKEVQMEWETFFEQILPVVVQVIKPLGRNDMWSCSCASEESQHSEDCVCPCKCCDAFRHCPCILGECTCPALCNCACSHCYHHDKPDDEPYFRICANEECSNPAPAQRSRGRYCYQCRWIVTKQKCVSQCERILSCC